MTKKIPWALSLLFLALLLTEAIVAYRLQTSIPRNGDITIHINAADRIVKGEKLYRDIVTMNFPMPYYLRVPGVLAAKALSLSPISVALLFDNVIALFAIGLSLLMLRKTSLGAYPPLLWFLGLVLIYVTCIFPVDEMIIGEKEYFFWLFTLPYFMLTSLRSEHISFTRSWRIFIGLFAAIGFCFKPFCLLPLLLVEGTLCLQARSLRPLWKAELIACATAGLSYLLWMIISFPEYFSTIMPMATIYFASHYPYPMLIRYAVHMTAGFFLPTLLLWLYCHFARPPMAKLFQILCLAYVGYGFAGLMQGKFSSHHLYAVWAMPVLLAALVLVFAWGHWRQAKANRSPAPGARTVMIAAASALCILFVETFAINPAPGNDVNRSSYWDRLLDRVDQAYHKQYKRPLTSFYKLGYRVGPMFPQGIYRGLPWNYHFYHMWPLGAITTYNRYHPEQPLPAAQTQPIEDYVRKTVIDDLLRLKPDAILIDRVRELDFIQFFKQDPRFGELMLYYKRESGLFFADLYIRQEQPLSPEEIEKQEHPPSRRDMPAMSAPPDVEVP